MCERIQDLFPAKETTDTVPETVLETVEPAFEPVPEPALETAVETPREADPREVLDTVKRGTIVALLRLAQAAAWPPARSTARPAPSPAPLPATRISPTG